jgi:hypothetical protein
VQEPDAAHPDVGAVGGKRSGDRRDVDVAIVGQRPQGVRTGAGGVRRRHRRLIPGEDDQIADPEQDVVARIGVVEEVLGVGHQRRGPQRVPDLVDVLALEVLEHRDRADCEAVAPVRRLARATSSARASASRRKRRVAEHLVLGGPRALVEQWHDHPSAREQGARERDRRAPEPAGEWPVRDERPHEQRDQRQVPGLEMEGDRERGQRDGRQRVAAFTDPPPAESPGERERDRVPELTRRRRHSGRSQARARRQQLPGGSGNAGTAASRAPRYGNQLVSGRWPARSWAVAKRTICSCSEPSSR